MREPQADADSARSAQPGLSRGSRIWAAVIGAALLLLVVAPAALAADSVYWATSSGSAIRVGNLGGSAANLFTGESDPYGVAIDPAAGKIYWADAVSNAIRVANLNGSGPAINLFTGESDPVGVAIDPAAGKIYWVDDVSSGTIRVANLNGTGSASTLFGAESNPQALAIDPAAGKIYWTAGSAIRVGNLNGSGSASNLFTGETSPEGVAIDAAAGKIYWASYAGAIRVGYLNGTASAADLFTGESGPYGLAIDPTAGKIYWTTDGGGAVRVGNLNGSGPAADLFTGENSPDALALLRSPAGAAAPQVAGGSAVGSVLLCSQGGWAADLVGSFLYRAPQSFTYSWTRNGTPIAGAGTSSITANAPGQYACQVTGRNQAGLASQTSAAHGVLPPTVKITQAKISSQHHTAKFSFKATGATRFQCALVKNAQRKQHNSVKPHFAGCKSPKTYKHLKAGKYKFEVRALNANVFSKPAIRSFQIR